MAINNRLKTEDYKPEEIIERVQESLVGYMEPGQKIKGARIFYTDSNLKKPKHDVIFFWRALYVLCVDEYEFAMKVFGDWEQYNKFVSCSSPYRNTFKLSWDNEREMKHRSLAMSNVISAVESGDVKESKWLEKHILETAPKEDKKEKKKQTKEAIEATTPIDEVSNMINHNYDNLN